MKRSERGQSEVIGVVLLLGITIAAVTVTVATGSAALGLVTDEARSASVENGMSQLSSQSSLVALGGTDARRFDLGSVDGGQLRLDEEAGRVEVRIENGTDTITTYNGSIGTLEYVGDRRNVAMQGGGVWAMEGGRGRMISPPEYHYRGETLTFPIVRLIGDESSPTSGTGIVRRTANDPGAVTETANPLRNGTVVVEVESEYYEGWYDFFTRRADGTVTKDDANQTTTARLVVPEEVSFDRTLAVSEADGYSHSGNKNNELSEGDYVEGESFPSPGSLIADQIAAAADDNDNGTETCVTASGFNGCGTVGSGRSGPGCITSAATPRSSATSRSTLPMATSSSLSTAISISETTTSPLKTDATTSPTTSTARSICRGARPSVSTPRAGTCSTSTGGSSTEARGTETRPSRRSSTPRTRTS